MHLLLTGGGTAGHILPNIAVIETLKKYHPEIRFTYVASDSELDRKILNSEKIDFFLIKTGKLRRYFSFQNFIDPFKVVIGFFQSIKIILKTKPTLVFSKGGYVALPVVIAAKLLRVPVVIHESDSIPGLTTNITGFFANQVWAENTEIQKKFPAKFKKVNLPVRSMLTQGNKDQFHKKYNFSDSKQNLLIIGGSQGAQAINQFIFDNVNSLTKTHNIFHVCGAGKVLPINKPNYRQTDYLTFELADAYAWADIVLTRAGASTISELSSLQKKAILVPLPKSQSRGEQFLNAESFLENNVGVLIQQKKLNLETLYQKIEELNSVQKVSISTNTTKQKHLLQLFEPYMV